MNQPPGALAPRLNRPGSLGSRPLIGSLGLSLPFAALQPQPRAFVVFTADVEVIARFRAENRPIGDVDQLARILSGHLLHDMLKGRADFSPSDSTAPEAPGA